MKHVVMGTAGHIDHGKTTLVKRLTGVDTDRLEEEKRRGMTIELGFAPMTLPSGNVISIVDVPGHEKFIKSMASGVTGIDFVVLVIAADEGIMPQTREHLEILSLLEVKAGVVALTKCELASAEELAEAALDIRDLLKKTSLSGIEIIPVSAFSGQGIDKLIDCFEKLTVEASEKNAQKLFRLPIDRVFTMTGHGTVVTGTIHGGVIAKGDLVDILPGQISSKVRGIQVHNKQASQASAGDRCALNLSGLDKEDINRGDVACHKNTLKAQTLFDVSLLMVSGKGGVEHNQRVHVHIGSKEVLARVRLIGASQMKGNSSGYAQLRFEEAVSAIRGDRFIIRAYSPMVTLGGGKIIFHKTVNRKRFSDESVSALEIGAHGELNQVIALLLSQPGRLAGLDELYEELYEEREILKIGLSELVLKGEVLYLNEIDKYMSRESFEGYREKIDRAFEDFYRKNPFNYLIEREQLRSKVFWDFSLKDFSALMNELIQKEHSASSGNYVASSGDYLASSGNYLMKPGMEAISRLSNKKETLKVAKLLKEEGFALRAPAQLAFSLSMPLHTFESVERFLIQTGRIVELGNGLCVHREHFDLALSSVKGLLISQGSATSGEIRDAIGFGRKATIILLEYLDSIDVTVREENMRKPGINFMERG